MKKGSKIALAIVMCLTMGLTILGSSFVAFAAQTPVVFTVPSVTGATGATVDVPITISANSGLGSCDLVLTYDATKLTLVTTTDVHGTETSPSTLTGGVLGHTTAGTIKLAYANTTAYWDAGTIIDAQFTITSTTIGAIIPLTLTVTDITDDSDTPVNLLSSTSVVAGSVTVIQPATGVTLDKTSATLAIGATDTLTATVAPANTTDKTVTWSSSDTTIATVDANGKVTAVKAGTATIKATTTNGLTASYALTVSAPATSSVASTSSTAASSVASTSSTATSSVASSTSSKATAASSVAATSSKVPVPNTSDSNSIFYIMLLVLASAAFVVVFRFKKRTV